jgi:rhodanese-related sulfurtransferase
MQNFDRQSPPTAFEALQTHPGAMLIDCRTRAEWVYVGVPVLPNKTQKIAFIEWVDATGQPNTNFLSAVAQIASTDTPLYILCRSGVRSAAACQFLAESGFNTLINIEDGFEGDIGPSGHRANINGWKYCNLPWTQG